MNDPSHTHTLLPTNKSATNMHDFYKNMHDFSYSDEKLPTLSSSICCLTVPRSVPTADMSHSLITALSR